MSERDDATLLQLAEAVVDGSPVDWEATPPLDDASASRLERLRILASIARACGMPPETPRRTGPILFHWGHLEIREVIGEGAFGEVCLGWDTRLEREVAVKFLRAGATPAAARLLQEGRHLARIRHPGVVTVYGAEQLDGRVGIWMEHVRGRTLEDLLEDQGPFSPSEAFQIGIDLSRALGAVHGAGLVHRDVKARNVVREDGGRIVLMDFGAGAEAQSAVGDADLFAGTPIYQAPEVLRGASASPRSDLYGLGVLLYRLVTGSYPVAGATLEALRGAHARGDIQPLRGARPDLPAPFVRAVERALAADPGRRFANARQMEAALIAALEAPRVAARRRARILSGLAAAGLAVILAVGVDRARQRQPVAGFDRPPIAVADAVNMTEDRDLDALAGLLITSLEQSRALSVLTRSQATDILARAGEAGDVPLDKVRGREVGRKTNAAALLILTIRPRDTGYGLALEALDPRRNRRLFTASARAGDKEEIPGAIDALARRARAELEEDPQAASANLRPVAQITTSNLAAYSHYDRAERHISRIEMRDARAALETAVAIDSAFGLAYCRLAYACWWMADHVNERRHLAKAFDLIDRVPERHRFHLRAQGAVADNQGLEVARSILLEMERFYPRDKEMLFDIGDYSSHLNEFPAAVQYLDRVVAMDPDLVRALQHLARVYRDMGRQDRFAEWARRYVAADSSWDAYQLLGQALVAGGKTPAGMEALDRAREMPLANRSDVTITIANVHVFQGRRAEATEEWDRLLRNAPTIAARAGLHHTRSAGRVHQGALRDAVADLQSAIALARQDSNPLAEAMARIDAATLHVVGRSDARSAEGEIARCADLESSISYRDTYFNYWPFWGGLYKLHLWSGDYAAADTLARTRFAADKWYSPYVAAYRHAAKGECAQAAAAASQALEWGPAAENIQLLYFLGRCQLEHGQLDEATQSLLRLQTLYTHLTLGTPYYHKGLLLLGQVYERKGDTRRAAQTYRTLIDSWHDADRDLPDLLAARQRLESLTKERL